MTTGKLYEPRAWQRMLSGRRLNLLDPSPLDVEIEDIAHGLARVGRWNGQTKGRHVYSVAQHSLFVEALSEPLNPGLGAKEKLYILLHDAPEYVIGDLISPFKALIGDVYKDVESRLEAAIHLRFGLNAHPTVSLKKVIKQADRAAAYFEAITLAGFHHDEAGKLFDVPDVRFRHLPRYVEPWPTVEAEKTFLKRFHDLSSLCEQQG